MLSENKVNNSISDYIIQGVKQEKELYIRVKVKEFQWNELKENFGENTSQGMFNVIMSEFTGIPLDQMCCEQTEGNGIMGRKTIEPKKRKISVSVSLTEQEKETIIGGFGSLTKGILFLSELMNEAYKKGLLPDSLVMEVMNKYKN